MPLLPAYPAPPGNKNIIVATIAGPASYTQVAVATPPTGGFVVNARDVGLVDFDFAQVSVSDNGQYSVEVIHDNNPAAGTQSIRLLISVASTGAQVAGATDLSGRTFRINASGN